MFLAPFGVWLVGVFVLTTQHFPEDPRSYINHEFKKRCARRPAYSLRAFARDLDVGVSSLSEFLSAKSGLSLQMADHISNKLNLNEEHKEHFKNLIIAKYARSIKMRKEAKTKVLSLSRSDSSKISEAQFRLISDWYYLAMLDYIELKNGNIEIDQAAADLGLNRQIVNKTLRILQEQKLVRKNQSQFEVLKDVSLTNENIPSDAVKLFHSQILDKARNALFEQSLDEREFGAVIFNLNKSDLIEFKDDLRKMYIELAAKFNAKENKDSIYCLSVQLHKIYSDKKND